MQIKFFKIIIGLELIFPLLCDTLNTNEETVKMMDHKHETFVF